MSKDEPSTPKTIGNMNGPWAILLRVALASYPLLLGWCIWVTVQTFESKSFRDRGDRFTQTDALVMQAKIDARFAELPPGEWKARIIKMEENQTVIMLALGRIEYKISDLDKNKNTPGQ